jgi:exosortase family protein XrtF
VGYLKTYRPFLLFLAKFFGTYLILAAAYQLYLSRYDADRLEIDPATVSVAKQSVWILSVFEPNAGTLPHGSQLCMKIMFRGQYVARIIEGCNAVSVMILFASFIVAFSGRLRPTLGFIGLGCVLIHVLNVARIALLSVGLYHYPEYEHILHGVVFPLFIYAVVFVLWVLWVNKYSDYAGKAAKT